MNARVARLAVTMGLTSVASMAAIDACGGKTGAAPADGGAGSTLDGGIDAGTGGKLDASSDGGTASDGPLDAGAEAAPDVHAGAIVLPCTTAAGLEPGSPWPMAGRCPQRNAHTGATGSTTPSVVWIADAGALLGDDDLVIAADGTLYTLGAGNQLLAINPDGTTRWSTAVPAAAGVQTPPYIQPGTWVTWLAIGVDGTIYVWNGDLTAVTPAGAIAWTLAITSYPARPDYECLKLDVDPAGNVLVADAPPDAGSTLYAVAPAGTYAWRKLLPTGTTIVSSPTVGVDGAIYVIVTDTTGAFTLQALDSSGNDTWSAQLESGQQAPSIINDVPPVVSEDGTVFAYFATHGAAAGFRAFTRDGQPLSSSPNHGPLVTTVPLASGDRVYLLAYDGSITALSTAGATLWSSPPVGGQTQTLIVDLIVDAQGNLFSGAQVVGGIAARQTVILSPDGGIIYGPSPSNDVATMAIGSDGTLYGFGLGGLSAMR
jgi:hypothetical protein